MKYSEAGFVPQLRRWENTVLGGSASKVTAPMTFILQMKPFSFALTDRSYYFSKKVRRALSKYPGAIATTLTKVNEIYGGRTWTWFDFSKLWHLHSARRWRGNERMQATYPHVCSRLNLLNFELPPKLVIGLTCVSCFILMLVF